MHRSPIAVVMCLADLATGVYAQVEPERADGPIADFRGHKVVHVEVPTVREYQTALALTDDVLTHSPRLGKPIDMRVTPEQFKALKESGLTFKVSCEDLQAALDEETAEIRRLQAADDPVWYTNYHNYTDNKAYCQALAAAYPQICTYSVIGLSIQNREIFALRITGPGSPTGRPASLWVGGQHAREWINVPVPEYHAEQLLTKYATDAHVRYLVDHHEFLFVPIMNPDGYDYTWTNNRLWRKNRRNNAGAGTGCNNFGVDLNRNWGYQWGSLPQGGSSGSCSNETYRGTAPFSEAETQVMRDYIVANPRIRATMDWHSYGELVMSPWGYTDQPVQPASTATFFQNLDDQMAAAIFSIHGRTYDAGPVYTTIYPANGVSVDYAWGVRGAYGLTIELRAGGQSGFELPPAEIVPTCEETWAAFLVVADTLTACYGNCDSSTGSPLLTANDFQCFLNRFAAGDTWANCDASSGTPLLTANDFQCFLDTFAQGCQ